MWAINMLRVVAQSPARKPRTPTVAPVEARPDENGLLSPLSILLASGGDDRLTLTADTGVNAYGCASYPKPAIAEFASSTATTISERAFASVERARFALLGQAQNGGLKEAFDTRLGDMRQELRSLLRLDAEDAEVVFAPSGTDSALHVTYLVREILGGPLVNIMMVSDETGSGVPFAFVGRHFSGHAALGPVVVKGEPIQGFADDISFTGFAGRGDDGEPLRPEAIDADVVRLVERAIAGGSKVLLNAMDCSRTGLSGPSLQCLDFVMSQWPDDVRVVVDACQMRLGRRRLRDYLSRDFMVMITGSKFFTGPPFSGALLVPRGLRNELARVSRVPSGLRAYTGKTSWPRNWSIRSGLSPKMNFGEWLRWEAAIEEMRGYYAVPSQVRKMGLRLIETGLKNCLSCIDGIQEVGTSHVHATDPDNMQSIFPFVLSAGGRPLSMDEAQTVYRALNDEVLNVDASGGSACRMGQPVALSLDGGRIKAGAFRVSASARMIAEAWSGSDEKTFEGRLNKDLQKAGAALERAAALASGIS